MNPGSGLAGLLVDPANPNTCNVIFRSPQTSLPQLSSITETAPSAAVIPSANPLGSMAAVNIRLWDIEGNASTPVPLISNSWFNQLAKRYFDHFGWFDLQLQQPRCYFKRVVKFRVAKAAKDAILGVKKYFLIPRKGTLFIQGDFFALDSEQCQVLSRRFS